MFGSKPGTTLLQVAAGLGQDSECQPAQIKLALRLSQKGPGCPLEGALPPQPERPVLPTGSFHPGLRSLTGYCDPHFGNSPGTKTQGRLETAFLLL